MAKRTYEFKKAVVLEYFEHGIGSKTLAKKYGVSSSNIRIWIERYKALGDEGLRSTKTHKVYDFEFKMNAVMDYLESEKSYKVISEQLGILNPCLLCNWVNMYRRYGPEALRPKKPGRRQEMPSKDKKSINLEQSQDDSSLQEKLKELEEENYWLRMDNAILKEARRLRLEEEAKLNAKR